MLKISIPSAAAMAAVLIGAGPVAADAIDKAVERGVQALRQLQQPNGSWGAYGAGSTALASLALLECGAKDNEPAVLKAAELVRDQAVTSTEVYHISLAIMFLDRLADPRDVPLIQALAVRLMEAQLPLPQAGWNYRTTAPSSSEVDRLRNLRTTPADRDGEGKKSREERAVEIKLDGDLERRLTALAQLGSRGPRGEGSHQYAAGPDNSNSQFAVLALWIARRHGIPSDLSLRRAEYWYRASYDNGTWSYSTSGTPHGRAATTCAGLLGLAVGAGVVRDPILKTDPDGNPVKRSKRDPLADPMVRTALNYVAAELAATVQLGIPVSGAPERDYYFLWSFERVAMAYNLTRVGPLDWHTLGSALLIRHQQNDGSWSGRYGKEVDTSFALMFLRRSNLASDLSAALRVRQQAALTAKEPADDDKTPSAPALPSAASDADRLARELLEARPARQMQILERLRDEKGAEYSDALVRVIPKLGGDIQNKARDCLAERLARMTSSTLRAKLRDKDAEFRRAAALACAAKDDRSLVGDLIGALEDTEFIVVRAAAAALRSLTGEDFGPTANATPEERKKAIAAWKAWWKSQTP